MSEQLDFLTDHEVRQINSLVDTLDRSNFDYLQIEVGAMKVTIGKGSLPMAAAPAGPMPQAVAAAPVAKAAVATAGVPAAAASVPAIATTSSPAVAEVKEGWLPITATTMGRFYSRPDPKSPPYVQVGDRVADEDTVCLIEVMKLFNAIPAGVSGTVTQVCVQDAAVVEFGQVLFYVQP